jgi:hypothetical protein
MFPILVGHADALKLAVDHALTAIDTTIHVIFHNILFGHPIKDDQFDGIRWTILDTQAAARTSRRGVGKLSAITVWWSNSFQWIKLGVMFFEK